MNNKQIDYEIEAGKDWSACILDRCGNDIEAALEEAEYEFCNGQFDRHDVVTRYDDDKKRFVFELWK